VSDESQLQVRPKGGDLSSSLSKARSGLIARGRNDAAALTAIARPEAEERHGVLGALKNGLGEAYGSWGGRPIDEIREAAENGDARAQNWLALRYSIGFGVGSGRDLAEAVRWYRRAADQGDAFGQLSLGWMYDNIYLGVPGVGQDYVEAARWYRKAADQGYAPAEFHLGVMYDKGEGVPQDHAEAVRWYRRAADKGDAFAQCNLGLKYDQGEGVTRDHVEAAKLYASAANQDLYTAQFNLSLKYASGQGVIQDDVQAHLRMSLAAAGAGADDRTRYLAVLDRIAAKMNPIQLAAAQRLAARWYRKAADRGYTPAQFNLGLLYECGLGVPRDYVQAHMWMSLAAGEPPPHPEYAAARDSVAAKMNSTEIAEAQRLARVWKRHEATPE
jgi:hypothetical protein